MLDLQKEALPTAPQSEQLATYLKNIDDAIEVIKKSPVGETDWSIAAKNLIKEIFLYSCKVYDVDFTKIRYELHLCGSMAKEQATPSSDVDGYFLWEDPKGDPEKIAEIAKIELALSDMNNMLLGIYYTIHKFCPDPFGITPFRFHGTPDELYKKVFHDGVADVEKFLTAIETSRPVLLNSEFDLITELKSKIIVESDVATALYKGIVEEYRGPRTKDGVDLKRDILRPLDFMLMALRKEHKEISYDDGRHLVPEITINALAQAGHISYEFGDLLLSIAQDAHQLRFNNHLAADSEQDFVTISEDNKTLVKDLIDKVAIVRGIAKERLEMLKNGQDPALKKIELTSICEAPYYSANYERTEMTLDVTPFVLANPAQEYFQSQYATIRNNLLGDAEVKNAFKGIEKIPQHLEYLSAALTDYLEKSPKLAEGFKDWYNSLLQNAVGDLFDYNGNFLPWIKKILTASKPDCVLIGPEANSMKKELLNAYVANIYYKLIKNAALQQNLSADDQRVIAQGVAKAMEEQNNLHINNQLIRQQDVPYSQALNNLAEVILNGIELLKQIKITTANKDVIKTIDTHISKYEVLVKDIRKVAENPEASKNNYLHKAYTYYSNEFNAFQVQFKAQDRKLWVRFKEAIVYHAMQIASFFIKTTAQRFEDKVRNLEEFLTKTKHDFHLFSTVAAVDAMYPAANHSPKINI